MVTLKLEKGFGKRLASDDFLKNKMKYLTLHIITVTDENTKKMIRSDESKIIKNIKKITRASYGKGDDKLDVTDKVNIILKLESQIEIFRNVNNDFADFCLVFMNVLCPRCHAIKKGGLAKSASTSKSLSLHNCGYINYMMRSTHQNYLPHLFDGIIKCFVAYLIKKDKTKRWIEIFTHILLSQQGDNCPQDIYAISNTVHSCFLSNGRDKIQNLSDATKDKLELFYKHIYPGLNYFYLNQSQIFIRHGLEKNTNDYIEKMIYPHNDVNHGWRIHKITSINGGDRPTTYPAYAIEIDKFPFKQCGSHSIKEIYGCVKGYISHHDYKKNGGIIHLRYENNNTVMSRDHFFGESNISINNWVFTYRLKPPEHLKYEVKRAVKALLESNIPLLAEDYLDNYNTIFQLIVNKFIIVH